MIRWSLPGLMMLLLVSTCLSAVQPATASERGTRLVDVRWSPTNVHRVGDRPARLLLTFDNDVPGAGGGVRAEFQRPEDDWFSVSWVDHEVEIPVGRTTIAIEAFGNGNGWSGSWPMVSLSTPGGGFGQDEGVESFAQSIGRTAEELGVEIRDPYPWIWPVEWDPRGPDVVEVGWKPAVAPDGSRPDAYDVRALPYGRGATWPGADASAPADPDAEPVRTQRVPGTATSARLAGLGYGRAYDIEVNPVFADGSTVRSRASWWDGAVFRPVWFTSPIRLSTPEVHAPEGDPDDPQQRAVTFEAVVDHPYAVDVALTYGVEVGVGTATTGSVDGAGSDVFCGLERGSPAAQGCRTVLRAGQRRVRLPVIVARDSVPEDDEWFQVRLDEPRGPIGNAAPGYFRSDRPETAVGWVVDDDAPGDVPTPSTGPAWVFDPPVVLDPDDLPEEPEPEVAVVRGAGRRTSAARTFEIRLSQAAARPVRVTYRTRAGRDPHTFRSLRRTVSIERGTRTALVRVPLRASYERRDRFRLCVTKADVEVSHRCRWSDPRRRRR